ncbi:N-acetyltransferase [Gorillibacterium timonense]|uniref:N-acetyltransferase n=1 Tax=Gorillibacterium timonense TaxID=1689269 RepID=UPI00071C7A5C|nr:N-acetyltransferase [Gorillibacterium timonense]
MTTSTVACRQASEQDLDQLAEIIEGYARQGIMLPRTKEMLRYSLDSFVVAEVDGKLIGCGSLCQLGQDLVEIRSLGISNGYKGQGIGRKLVETLVKQAKAAGIPKVMALTYEDAFFQRVGFTVVEKEIFPEKVWKDCIHCSKQHCCDEIAVLMEL